MLLLCRNKGNSVYFDVLEIGDSNFRQQRGIDDDKSPAGDSIRQEAILNKNNSLFSIKNIISVTMQMLLTYPLEQSSDSFHVMTNLMFNRYLYKERITSNWVSSAYSGYLNSDNEQRSRGHSREYELYNELGPEWPLSMYNHIEKLCYQCTQFVTRILKSISLDDNGLE